MKNILFGVCCLFLSCSEGFLDAKPDKALVVPATLQDYRALLDDSEQQISQTPGLTELSTDDLYCIDGFWDTGNLTRGNAYVWKADIYAGEDAFMGGDWTKMYAQVLRMNVVLEGLNDIERNDRNGALYDELKGESLFFRAWHFFALLQSFSLPYDPATANQDLGIILKLSADINEKTNRADVETSYQRVLADLTAAVELLPQQTAYVSRPNLAAAYALLARVYLSRFDYENAGKFANLALEQQDDLMDFNMLDLNGRFPDPFTDDNPEMMLYSMPILFSSAFFREGYVADELYADYRESDLRKPMFFSEDGEGHARIKATYYASDVFPMTGLTTPELYLIKAECLVREGQTDAGLNVLDDLLRTRWDTEADYSPTTASDDEEALRIVLTERRKELVFKGLRWYDLRRLNKDPRFAKTLTRTYNGETYTLAPDSKRYAFPIPNTEWMANPGIQQNER
ncbi:RagB/SusD family nutrient uptake outer membrane protein [Parapedobacter lycopersici]|uniref:RagB/SusD family nutrient uptake outer membrane protein n=1 Tax=Parapedobacter lycopersici TaxID=1864939 RepID=UPI00214D9B8B|nr:RagB/SusD family nutrient uptake outer membrane protein [Parapedobacter lycopersici]